jgi:FtsP/CotA-like multicopper oxidase with cupredoxin domain
LKNLTILAGTLAACFATAGFSSPVKAENSPGPHVQTYYIAAEEVMWDYAPHGRNLVGTPGPENEATGDSTKYRKAVYHEYTDATFTVPKPRPPEWQHLGILGPLIRAEVGDVVRVYFKNNTNIFCGMHPHGLAYGKDSEGATYNDGAQVKKGDAVAPGQTYLYTWTVPERAGPAQGDGSSILWVYHSHFVEPRDMNTGLFGPIIVAAKGSTKPDGTPKDVDREFVVAFAVFDETESWYVEANSIERKEYALGLKLNDPAFRQRHLLYSMNGLIEGNLSGMTMKKGERVRWYLLSNSNEDDVHTPHWHGQTVIVNNMRSDMVSLGPMAMMVADMVPDNVGTWLFHCHVNDHIEGGMQALFSVAP